MMVAFDLEDISMFTRLFVGSFDNEPFPCHLPVELPAIAEHCNALDFLFVEARVMGPGIFHDFKLLAVVSSLNLL